MNFGWHLPLGPQFWLTRWKGKNDQDGEAIDQGALPAF